MSLIDQLLTEYEIFHTLFQTLFYAVEQGDKVSDFDPDDVGGEREYKPSKQCASSSSKQHVQNDSNKTVKRKRKKVR